MIVKVGVIGIGTVSQLMHLPILSGLHEQYQITAVSDISPTQLAFIAKKYNATPYTDPYELVKDPNVDAVFVCSPDQYHAAYALAAMEAGKHVFVEKPVTLCMEDLEKLLFIWQEATQSRQEEDRILLQEEIHQKDGFSYTGFSIDETEN